MKIYNSLNFKKEQFKTLHPNEVLMYVCGPTVYDSPHLGHAKSAITFDLIHRYFKFKGYNVKLVKNYTDIDDKIINRANERGIDFKTLGEQYIKEYEDIMDVLNILKDYKNPRATEVIDFMVKIIEGLISKGHAYESNGSVYFDVTTFPKYKTIFQNISQEEGESGEEQEGGVEIEQQYLDEKRNKNDFALWKKSKEDEPFWESPWGKGRPGWHIECSAMALKFLGETIDIHGGGQDLKFPHHRNEISQSEAYTGKAFANYFIHNGFVNVDNEKMSKSLGNFFLVSDVIKEFDPIVVRFFLISSHYRKSINYSLENMRQAEKNYKKILNTIMKINEMSSDNPDAKESEALILKINLVRNNIIKALDDDFNTPVAIAEIFTLFRELNQAILENKVAINDDFKDVYFSLIKDVDDIFGLFPTLKKQLISATQSILDDKDQLIKSLLGIISEIRKKLRKKKIYDLSDEIREELRKLGLKVEDN